MEVSALPFAKGHALGNDYLVVDAADLPWPLSPVRVRALCDRHRGAGADGVLLGHLREDPIRLEIFNPDGSVAEKSGNGLRIFAAYLHGRKRVGEDPFEVRLPRDRVTLHVEGAEPAGALRVLAEMGEASFRGGDVGFRPEPGEVDTAEVPLGEGAVARIQPVSLANPHCVVFVDELRREDFDHRAPQLVAHPAFAEGTNVQFARVVGPATLEAWIWERGVGETLASGSSACAVAAAALREGRIDAREVEVRMRGGSVAVWIREDGMIHLRGPAQIVYSGEIAAPVAAAWGR